MLDKYQDTLEENMPLIIDSHLKLISNTASLIAANSDDKFEIMLFILTHLIGNFTLSLMSNAVTGEIYKHNKDIIIENVEHWLDMHEETFLEKNKEAIIQ